MRNRGMPEHGQNSTIKGPIMITPSIRTLQTLPGVDIDHARKMKSILRMNRDQLLALPIVQESIRGFYNPPFTSHCRMLALNAILGSHGIESFRTKKGEIVDYLNMGDPYILTIIRFRGNYRVTDWGTIAELHGSM